MLNFGTRRGAARKKEAWLIENFAIIAFLGRVGE
jgi:hypothetical protein